MILDIITRLLAITDHPGKMGAFLTRQIREVVGARRVLLVQAPLSGDSQVRLLSVEPSRLQDAIPLPDLSCLAGACRPFGKGVFLTRADASADVAGVLARAGIENLLACSLMAGAEWAGMLFVMDLLDVSRTRDNLEVLDVLSPVVALALRNASFFEVQETEIRLRTQALARSERHFRTLAEVAPVGIFQLDVEGNFRFANERMRQILGACAGIPDAEQWAQDLHPEDRAAVESALGRTLTLGQTFRAEFRLLSPAGEWLVVLGEALPERDEQGAITGFIGTVTDITQRRREELERFQLEKQLRQSQKMEILGNLAGGVAHDMNNVLGAILSLASAHQSLQPKDSPVSKAFATIAEAASRGGKMVKSMLAFARQTPAEESPLDLNTIISEDISLLEHTLLAQVRVVLDLEADLPPIRGDASALKNVFMNLFVNAVDAITGPGVLTVRTRTTGNDRIEAEVEDTGAGMTPEVLARAMDPFFTTKEPGKGTGLGLSMVYSAMKTHQGDLDIRSEPAHGTCVRLTFPVCRQPVPAPEPVPDRPARAAKAALRVLLVDDDELVRESTRMLLEVLGHSVTTAASGEECLLKLQDGEQDLVLLDLNMPGIGGAGTLPLLRARCPGLPVLLATGRADQLALDLVDEFPLVTLLAKPFALAELRGHLERHGQA